MYKLSLLVLLLCISKIESKYIEYTIGKNICTNNCENYIKVTDSDTYAVIQNTLEIIKNNKNGGKLKIKEGEYIVEKNIVLYSNVVLEGDGMNKTILKLKNLASPWKTSRFSRAGFLRAVFKNENKCENITILDLSLNGNKNNQNKDENSKYGRFGIFTEACDNIYIKNIRIHDFQGYGFDPHGWKTSPSGALWANNLTILNSHADNNDWDGFTLDQTDGIYIKDSISINNGRHGFNIVTGSKNLIAENLQSYNNGYYYYTGDGGCGIAIQNNRNYGTKNIKIFNSSFYNDKRNGLCSKDVINLQINNNDFITMNECISLSNVNNSEFINNKCNSLSKNRFFNEKNTFNIIKNNNILVNNAQEQSNIKDPLCNTGIKNKNICCLKSCGTCGGTGCGLRVGKSFGCCISTIINNNRRCSEYGPPCII